MGGNLCNIVSSTGGTNNICVLNTLSSTPDATAVTGTAPASYCRSLHPLGVVYEFASTVGMILWNKLWLLQEWLKCIFQHAGSSSETTHFFLGADISTLVQVGGRLPLPLLTPILDNERNLFSCFYSGTASSM